MIGESNLKDSNIWEDAMKEKQKELTNNLLEKWLVVVGSSSTGNFIEK